MTVRLLSKYADYPINAIVSLDAATEAGLVAQKIAATNLTGGVTYAAPAATSSVGSRVELARKLLAAELNGAFPQPAANVVTATVTGTWTPTAVAAGAVSDQIFTVADMLPGDVVILITPPSAMHADLRATGRYISPTSVGVWFRNLGNAGVSATPPSGIYTVTVARFSTVPADVPFVTMSAMNAATAVGAAGTFLTRGPTSGAIRVRQPSIMDAAYSNYAGSGISFMRPDQNLTINPSRARGGSIFTAEWVTDAAKVEIPLIGNGVTFQFLVDGKIVTPTPLNISTTYGYHRVLLDFTQGGTISSTTRRMRKIRIEADKLALFGGVTALRSDTVIPPVTANPVKGLVFGDSWVEGRNPYHPIRTTLLAPYDGWANRVGDLLGWDENVVCGVGGTGYASDAMGDGYKFRDRINDIINAAPDIIVIFGSLNDFGKAVATIKSEATLFFSQLTAALPATPIIVFGVQPSGTASITSYAATNTAVKEGIAAVASPNITFVDILSAPNTWVSGTGYVGNVQNNGNADWVLDQADGHPTHPGMGYLAYRAADTIRPILRSYLV